MPAKIDLTGQRFARLVVLSQKEWAIRSSWVCKCDCGNETVVFTSHLSSGHTTSCGCARNDAIRKANRTHGLSSSGAYKSWSEAKYRCTNPDSWAWEDYGGRGIAMHPLWADSFEAFYEELGPRPDGCELDRIEVNGNYEPGNCRWLHYSLQNRNKRSNVRLSDGRCLIEVAEDMGVEYHSFYHAYVTKGFSLEKIATMREEAKRVETSGAMLGRRPYGPRKARHQLQECVA